jgi:hypothetical protein
MNGTDNDGDDGGLALGGGYEALWERFMKYKNRVPVCGGILLDEGCQSVSFPAFIFRSGGRHYFDQIR